MSCEHGNWPPCELCDALDAAYERGFAAGKLAELAAKPSDQQGASTRNRAAEWGEYMAKGAERLIDAVNEYHVACGEDGKEPDADAVAAAEEALSEAMTGLRSDVYEFRKRASKDQQGASLEGDLSARLLACAATTDAYRLPATSSIIREAAAALASKASPDDQRQGCDTLEAAVMLAERTLWQDDEGVRWVPEAAFQRAITEICTLESKLYPIASPPTEAAAAVGEVEVVDGWNGDDVILPLALYNEINSAGAAWRDRAIAAEAKLAALSPTASAAREGSDGRHE